MCVYHKVCNVFITECDFQGYSGYTYVVLILRLAIIIIKLLLVVVAVVVVVAVSTVSVLRQNVRFVTNNKLSRFLLFIF